MSRKLFAEDIVNAGKNGSAYVQRLPGDLEDYGVTAEDLQASGMQIQTLSPDEVEVVTMNRKYKVLNQSEISVVDRALIPGDLVRLSPSSSQQPPPSNTREKGKKGPPLPSSVGTVTHRQSYLLIRSVFHPHLTKSNFPEPPPFSFFPGDDTTASSVSEAGPSTPKPPTRPNDTWIPSEMLTLSARLSRGDHVVHGDWVGVIEEVVDEGVVEIQDAGETVQEADSDGAGLPSEALARAGDGSKKLSRGLMTVCDVASGALSIGERLDPRANAERLAATTNLAALPHLPPSLTPTLTGTGPSPTLSAMTRLTTTTSPALPPTGFLDLPSLARHENLGQGFGPAGNVLAGFHHSTGAVFANAHSQNFGRVLNFKQTVVAVNWLAMNQLLTPAEQEKRPRPKRFWSSDINQLYLVRSGVDAFGTFLVGSKVLFKEKSDAEARGFVPPPKECIPNAANDAFQVIDSRSRVRVLWQDGSTSECNSIDLEPVQHAGDEEHDTWPGDLVAFVGSGEGSTEGDRKVAVVQKVDERRRTAEIKWYGSEEKEVVSVLETDPHGPSSSYGVRRRDICLISAGPTGAVFPNVSRLGQSEALPNLDILRTQVAALGFERSTQHPRCAAVLPKTGFDLKDIDWYGEVEDLLLDGSVLLRLPGGQRRTVSPDRLVLFDDLSTEQPWDMDFNESEFSDGMSLDDDGTDGTHSDVSMKSGSWLTEDGLDDGEPDLWAAVDEEVPVETVKTDESGMTTKEPTPRADDGEGGEDANMLDSAEELTPPSSAAKVNGHTTTYPWLRFSVLEAAPKDHAFISEIAQPPTKTFLTRLRKEYQVLESSLPDTILVRAYEDRADLLRCLIIGPPGTPYQDAPFLIDFFLPPSKYPQEPPKAHFHSWTGGAGRCNPNLYQEGKICLSSLGTWSGDKTESWSPQRSSVFTVLVSIQGLVLVQEPWFLEPGYENQRGTAEAMIASAHYSERAYVLTRNFIRHALEYPVKSFADEIQGYYVKGGRLSEVVEEVRELVRASEEKGSGSAESGIKTGVEGEGEVEGEDGVPVLPNRQAGVSGKVTPGGLIPLKRTLKALEKLEEGIVVTAPP